MIFGVLLLCNAIYRLLNAGILARADRSHRLPRLRVLTLNYQQDYASQLKRLSETIIRGFMYVVIVGCGRVGSQLAVMLSGAGHDVVIIDSNPQAFRRLGAVFNGITITGLGFDEQVLREAGIEKADAFAAVTELDNTNLMTAEVASKIFGVKKVITRLYHPDREATYRRLDVDYVCGTTIVASKIYEKVTESPYIFHHSIENKVHIVEFSIGKSHSGKTIGELENPPEFKVITVTRAGVTSIPDERVSLQEKDKIIAAINKNAIHYIERFSK